MKKLKFTIVLTLIFTFSLVFTSCDEVGFNSEYSAKQMADIIVGSQENITQMTAYLPEDENFSDILMGYYGVEADMVEDAVIYQAVDRAIADEIVLLKLSDSDNAKISATALADYKHNRTGDFTGYAPEEEAVAEAGVVLQNGDYAVLIICDDIEFAEEQYLACFTNDPPLVPSTDALFDDTQTSTVENDNTNDVDVSDIDADNVVLDDGGYSHDAVLSAWESGDSSNLNEVNKTVLDICTSAINSQITSGMSELEKERAIHDFIVRTTDYDRSAIGATEETVTSPDHDNPYGTLVHGKAICSGYTSTFQLMMDMVGIECITVEGTAHSGTDEHAWNMVNIDDTWYCVDVTWDDPTAAGQQSEQVWHTYFNVSSEKMRQSDHQWDEANYPVAN